MQNRNIILKLAAAECLYNNNNNNLPRVGFLTSY